MKTTTILLLIAAAGMATGCRTNKSEDRYNYSDTTYRPSDTYYPSTSSTSSSTTTSTVRPETRTTSGSTVWRSSNDTQNINRDQSNMNRDQNQYNQNRNQYNADQNRTGNQNQQNQNAQLKSQDQDFLKQAATDGQKEVELARLAVRQGSNEKIRNFGQMLIDDHTKANDELTTLARQKNVDVTTQRTAQDRSQMERFGQLQGADFDKQFIDQMIQDHQRAIDLFDRQSRTGDDAQVKAFASRTLPKLRSHLQMAKDIQADLNATDLGVPNRTPAGTPGTEPYRNPNQPIQPFDPNNPNQPRNPNNPDPLNPSNTDNPSSPSSNPR